MDRFQLVSDYKPSGDQPEAITSLVNGVNWGLREQTLLGVTGSGKTFTMASVIEKLNRPTLVLAHNKTLAAQLCSEFREFFPNNAVEYFISYYDYYQPEAYIAHTDTYIEKDASVNEEIDRLRHSATSALFERRDVIVVSSVSCLYGLATPSITRAWSSPCGWATSIRWRTCCASWRRSAMSAMTWTSPVTSSGFGAIPWKSILPSGRVRPSGWSFSVTRWIASVRSTPFPVSRNGIWIM